GEPGARTRRGRHRGDLQPVGGDPRHRVHHRAQPAHRRPDHPPTGHGPVQDDGHDHPGLRRRPPTDGPRGAATAVRPGPRRRPATTTGTRTRRRHPAAGTGVGSAGGARDTTGARGTGTATRGTRTRTATGGPNTRTTSRGPGAGARAIATATTGTRTRTATAGPNARTTSGK